MQYYSVKLRLNGNPMNEVRNVYSAPEILILQYIHGVNSLTDIEKVKVERLNLRDFKDLLKAKYDPALVKRDQSIDKIFGALGQLPTKLPDHLLEQFDIVDEDDVISVAKSATRAQKVAPQSEVETQRLERIVPQNEVSMDDIME